MVLRIPTRIALDASFQGRTGRDILGLAAGSLVVDASLFLLTPRRRRRQIGRIPVRGPGKGPKQVLAWFRTVVQEVCPRATPHIRVVAPFPS